MIPVLYSVQTDEKNKKGIIFANSYTDAVKKIEKEFGFIVDLYLTSVSGEEIELTDEAYNKIIEGSSL